jgi:hypothetical protein
LAEPLHRPQVGQERAFHNRQLLQRERPAGNSNNGTNANSKCGGGVGPTSDGRLKPDLFTPGCSIVSANSSVTCGTRSMTGTSMACPNATAAGALVRQYFMDGFHPRGVKSPGYGFVPSAALIKAVLINACQDMTGVAGYPSATEGWGRVVLDDGLYFAGDAAKLFVAERRNAEGLSTNQTIEFQLEVRSGSVPLEVTCAFTDFAGTVNASNPVVNDLDLVVLSPGNAQTFLGNVFAGGWSATGGIADAKNNIERVAVLNPAVGTWTLRITGRNVPQNRQGFGLCANGDLAGCLDLAASVAYGAGKAGLRGVPLLGAGTLPRLPSMWQLSLSRALENAPAILLFSAMPASIAFDGATILVDPQVFLAVGTSPTGSVNLPFQLPDDAILCGISTYWQAWIPNDPGAAGMGWAASNGLAMRMGW